MQVVEADLTWTGEKFERGIRIEVRDDGRIANVGRLDAEPTLRLTGEAILPGFISAHSHTFHRALRGKTEKFPHGKGSFGTWRDAMYALVADISADELREICLKAYREMRASGITTVGEFHYLHHSKGSSDFALDQAVLDAAAEAGIRIVMLSAFYRNGGFGKPLVEPQQRFETRNLDEYWANIERLQENASSTQTVGTAAHSLRTTSIEDIEAIYTQATGRGMVFHIQVEGQLEEVEGCIAAYGQPPMAILNDRLEIMSNFTAVHCTHTRPEDLERFVVHGGIVCITPVSEGNLGDGVQEHLHHAGHSICVGSGSNSRISLLEELRWLEYTQRLASRTRGVFCDTLGSSSRMLMEFATTTGARSLGVSAGKIGSWKPADFLTIDLEAHSLEGWTEDTLLDSLIFGASDDVILRTAVDGKWINHRG